MSEHVERVERVEHVTPPAGSSWQLHLPRMAAKEIVAPMSACCEGSTSGLGIPRPDEVGSLHESRPQGEDTCAPSLRLAAKTPGSKAGRDVPLHAGRTIALLHALRIIHPMLPLQHGQALHQGNRLSQENANAWKKLRPKKSSLGHFLFRFPLFLPSCLGLRGV